MLKLKDWFKKNNAEINKIQQKFVKGGEKSYLWKKIEPQYLSELPDIICVV